jgi:hypothetical protein
MNFSKDSIRTLSNSKFVIIPDNQQNIYKEELIKYGIDKNNIVSIEYQDYFNQPKFIESINNYNIVGYKENIFGIPQSLGSINLETADFNLLKDKVIVFNNLKDVESLKYKV